MPDITAYELKLAHAKVELGEDVDRANYLMSLKLSDGKAYKATDAAGYRFIGVNYGDRCFGDEGDTIIVKEGIFKVANDTGAGAITKADIKKICYIKDSETVTMAEGSSHLVIAGRIVDYDEDNDLVLIEMVPDYTGVYEAYSS